VGSEDGTATVTILEFYRDNRREIDILDDTRALFVLTFIAENGNTSLDNLVSNLGWPREEVSAIVQGLDEAQLLRDTEAFNPENPIRLAPQGLSMLETLRFPTPPKNIQEVSPPRWADALPLWGFAFRGYARPYLQEYPYPRKMRPT
jgi:hypothetical protein